MAKDPAILFYTSDFLTGTMTMTDDQVGKYIRLLCLQHQKGLLSEKDMMHICKSYDEDIFSKFKKTDAGYLNERLHLESEKRKKYSKSRSDNRKKGTHKQHVIDISKTYVQHMENENEDVIEIVNGNKVGGMGEGKKHDADLQKLEVQNTIEYIHRLKAIMLTETQVTDYWPAFKMQMQPFYSSRTDVIRHFQNWLKNNVKNGSTTKSGSNGKPTRSDEYAEAYRRLVGE